MARSVLKKGNDEMRQVNKIIETSSEYISIFSGLLIFAMSVLSTYEAVIRTFLNAPTKWTLPLSGFFMIYAVFFSSAYCFLKDGHIRIELLLDKVDEVKRRLLLIIGNIVCAVVVIVVSWKGIILTSRSFKFGWLTQTAYQVRIGYINIAIPIGCFLMLLALYVLINKNRTGAR